MFISCNKYYDREALHPMPEFNSQFINLFMQMEEMHRERKEQRVRERRRERDARERERLQKEEKKKLWQKRLPLFIIL